MTARTLQRCRLVHTWSSVICTAFLFVLCVTGLPLVFRDEIDGFLQPHPQAPSLPADTPRQSLDQLIAIAKARDPAKFIDFVFWDASDPNILGLGVSDSRAAGLANVTRVLVDARTGAPLGAAAAEGSFTDTLADIHRNLCAGVLGDVLLGVMALAFLVSIASGVVVYAPLLRRIGFGVVRAGRDRRILQLDLHNLAGMLGLLWALVVGVTGFVNTLEAPLFAAWDSATLPALLAPYAGKPPIARASSVDAAVATAVAALPDMRPTSVGFPETSFGSPRHYLIWMRGNTFFSSRLFTPVLVDAEAGTLALARPFPWYLRVLEASRPLHFGDYGGLALKLVWALFDASLLVVLASGMYLWIRRLRRWLVRARLVETGIRWPEEAE